MSARVLVSGAGIAGCCLAWWLQRYGFDVTVIEQAMRPRDGGYVIDFWGLGYEVAAKMGLVDELRRHDLDIHEFRIVDRRGRRITSIDQGALGELTGGKVMSLPRAAVASTLYGAIEDRVPVRFGNSITSLADGPDGVEVRFEHGEPERFDLVIGADGLHSVVRRLLFGDEFRFERYLGYCVAAFSTTGYPHRDPHTYVTYGEPGRQIWRITKNDDTTVFLLVFAEAEGPDIPVHDVERQKAMLARRYAGGGWETGEVLRALESATDLYFDRVSQIAVPRWSEGRVALIGDACACPSLLAGEGSAMAMAEAYTLAGELAAPSGDHVRAFAAYEGRLRPYVERKQKGARGFAAGFVPTSAFGLWSRNAIIDVVGRLGLTRMLFGAQLNDRLTLPAYGGSDG
jgi:2-polyprenyl-6-methoxyphenol hydroxylase-like FAD-dependent oxidoreductase